MKKIIFIICISLVIAANAQYDTLPYNIGIPNYFMNHPLDSMHITYHDSTWCYPDINNMCDFIIGKIWTPNVVIARVPYAQRNDISPVGDMAFGFYPDSTVHITGVAWYNPLWMDAIESTSIDSNWAKWDTIDVKLFLPTNATHMSPVVSKKCARNAISVSKIMDPSRGWSYDDFSRMTTIHPLRTSFCEIYFDSELDITDSFYISVKYTWNSGWPFPRNWDNTMGWIERHNLISGDDSSDIRIFPAQSYRFKKTPGDDDSWYYGEIPAYLLLFPIIRRDCDSCPEVHELRYTKVGNSAAIVQWDAGANHSDWQLCYGTPGFDPDGAEATTIRVPQHALTGLSATAHYDVYVKARCQFDRSEYSPWAGPFDLCLSELGIDGADAVEAEIGPNPTSGMLTVRCEAEIKAVELYDMQSRCVANGEVGTASGEPRMATLQVQHLPAGTYTAVVRTAHGSATKQVVVL